MLDDLGPYVSVERQLRCNVFSELSSTLIGTTDSPSFVMTMAIFKSSPRHRYREMTSFGP